MPYPIYRKLIDGRSIYRIGSAERFTEVQFVGTRAIVHHVMATTYPEMVRMDDMIRMTGGHYVEAAAAEFSAALAKAEGA